MTKEDTIKMAQQCGLIGMRPHLDGIYSEALEAFAKLVADKKVEGMVMMTPDEFKNVWDKAQSEEREACAKVCEAYQDPFAGNAMADAIRARGQA